MKLTAPLAPIALICCGAFVGDDALAQAQAPAPAAPPTEQTIVITGSVRGQVASDAPFAISTVSADELRAAGPMINLSEAVARVPGLNVANRNNQAQDLQISSRGFGARSAFGVRGVRLYTDGIPASMPDGQGQVSHFDLANAQRIEVLRGPFSVLYGNSSGGVIAAYSEPVKGRRISASLDAGSFGLRQWRLGGAAELGGGWDARLSVSGMQSDGTRDHAASEKQSGHLRVGWQGEHDRVAIIVNALDQPADDPLGLTRAQFEADPTQTASVATQFNTRKTLRQQQLGVNWQHHFGQNTGLTDGALTVYAGQRSVMQWLAIAAGTQANARHGGGVIDLDRSYQGVDARLNWRLGEVDLTTGVAADAMRDDRRGYLNYTGTQASPTYGVVGALRRDEANQARSQDAYVQAEWKLTPTLLPTFGVRGGKVKLSANDQYLSNGNDSGARSFNYVNPVLGLRWKVQPRLTAHVSVARGVETPTLGELSYRVDGTGGFNTDLQAQKSSQFEAGVKWQSDSGQAAVEATLFHIQVSDEIGVATNAGGRQSFRNVGRTQRQGFEIGANWSPLPGWRGLASVTLLDATYRDGFLACTGIPCTAASVPVAAGNRIAGTQKGMAYAEVAWSPVNHLNVALEVRAASALMANDTNTEAAPRYAVWALRALHRIPLGDGYRLELLGRIDNLTDKRHAGTVIVNDANGRFYEPGAPRSFLLSLRATKQF